MNRASAGLLALLVPLMPACGASREEPERSPPHESIVISAPSPMVNEELSVWEQEQSEVMPDGEPSPFPYLIVEGEPLFTVLEKDGIPAIDEPVFVSAQEADGFMELEETVLGVVGKDGTAKCYSVWQLDGHEIVNDELDGEPIAATW